MTEFDVRDEDFVNLSLDDLKLIIPDFSMRIRFIYKLKEYKSSKRLEPEKDTNDKQFLISEHVEEESEKVIEAAIESQKQQIDSTLLDILNNETELVIDKEGSVSIAPVNLPVQKRNINFLLFHFGLDFASFIDMINHS